VGPASITGLIVLLVAEDTVALYDSHASPVALRDNLSFILFSLGMQPGMLPL